MSKKKHKELKKLDKYYKQSINDIKFIQDDVKSSEKKNKRKAKRDYRKDKSHSKEYYLNKHRRKTKEKYLKYMSKGSTVDKINYQVDQAAPMIKLSGKFLAAMIVAFLSMDVVKANISEESLEKVDKIYKIARKL